MWVAGGAAAALALGGCASGTPDGESEARASSDAASATNSTQAEDSQREREDDMKSEGKVLVAYFSNTGNTEAVAERIAQLLRADLFRIEPKVPYSTADLDYNDDDARCMRELNDLSSRPAIANLVEGWASYDAVLVGYPIWWSRTPPIMETFAESYDWSGKTATPFCTSGSSGIGQSADVLEEESPGAVWLPGKRFARGASEDEIKGWLDSLGL